MHKFRYAKLPNETGGVLMGTFDTSEKIIYVVLVLPSPPDSIERQQSFEEASST